MELILKRIRKAVFPVGGLGTRFLPATKAMPKEMLAVVDKPLIQYAVEEALAAGIEEFIFVTGKGKTAIEDHFDQSPELEAALKGSGAICGAGESGSIAAVCLADCLYAPVKAIRPGSCGMVCAKSGG